MGTAVPISREVMLRKLSPDEQDFVANSVMGVYLDERRLHADFQDTRFASVDETRPLTKSVRIAREDHAMPFGEKS
jgi:hypothetical protein